MIKEKLLSSLLFLLCGFSMFAQQKTITGVVTDDQGIPVPSANVTLKDNPQQGTYTNFDGEFTINASSGDVLVISAIGLATKEVPVDAKNEYEISLTTDVSTLDEVVITGFDNVEKRLFTGANSTITAENLKVDGVVDVSRMLEGKAAGVNVQNVTGTFGAAPKITIRGASSIFGDTKPLFVIDGVVQEDIVNLSFAELTSGNANTLIGSSIAGLNANDIQNIEVLKDASATALYGARALNGVVVITTKSGRKETPATINYTLEQTVRDIPRYSQYDILNSQESMSIFKEMENKGYLELANTLQGRYGGVYYGMYDKISTYIPETDSYSVINTPESRNQYLRQYEMANTDWFKTLFRQSLTQNHSLSFTGGGKHNSYYASVSFYTDPGWTIADEVKRLTANFKNTFFISDKFNLTLSTKASNRQQEAPGTFGQQNDVVRGEVSREFDINPFSYALNTNRTLRPYDNNGNYEYSWSNWAPFNIIHELDNNYMELNVLDYLFQIDADYDITDDITYNLTASGRYVKSTNEHNVTENSNVAEAYRSDGTTIIRDANIYLYSDPDDPSAVPVSVLPEGGIYNRTDNSLESYYLRNTFNYSKKINNTHDVNVLLGQDLRYIDRESTNFRGWGLQYDKGYVPFTTPGIFDKTLAQGSDYYGLENEFERTVSFFGKATYGYDNRYVISATGRYDGSNRQGQTSSSRWLPTWSVSGKWNAKQESFLRNVNSMNTAQIRASYGLTATAGPATNSLVILRSDITDRYSVNNRENYLEIEELQNNDLTWEKQHEINLGLDLGFFANRISLSTDVYQRKGFDLIDYVRTSGLGGQLVKIGNNADMTTKGIEISLSTKNIVTDDFTWSSILNFSAFDQEVTKLQNQPIAMDLVGNTGGSVVGYPRNSLFSYDFTGLDDRGLPTFNLPAGNNISNDPNYNINGANFQARENLLDYLVYEGPTEPNKTAGFSNTFTYKNWSLNVFISASWGNKVRLNPAFRNNGASSVSFTDLDVFTKDYLNRWQLPGDENITDFPVIPDQRLNSEVSSLGIAYNTYNYSTARVADGGFVRMKNISLSYNFPKTFQDKLGLSNLSLKVLTTNPFLIYSDSKLNGQDPEFFQSGGVAYPITRQYTLSLYLGI